VQQQQAQQRHTLQQQQQQQQQHAGGKRPLQQVSVGALRRAMVGRMSGKQ
jgi:hypothetical protein